MNRMLGLAGELATFSACKAFPETTTAAAANSVRIPYDFMEASKWGIFEVPSPRVKQTRQAAFFFFWCLALGFGEAPSFFVGIGAFTAARHATRRA